MPHEDDGASRWPRRRFPPALRKPSQSTTPTHEDTSDQPPTDHHADGRRLAPLPPTSTGPQGSPPSTGQAVPRLPEFSSGIQRHLKFQRMFVESGTQRLLVHLGSCYAHVASGGSKGAWHPTGSLDWLLTEWPHETWEQELVPWSIYLSPSVQGRPALKEHARGKLIERYLHDTTKVGKWYFRRKIPEYSMLEEQDIIAAGLSGMVECIDKYNPIEFHLTFMQFANARGFSRIQGAITDSLRILMDCTRSMSALRRVIAPLMSQLRNEIGRKPNVSDFCARYGESYRERLEDALFGSRVYNQSRATTEDGESADHMSSVQDGVPSHEWMLNDEDAQGFYDAILKALNDPHPPVCNEQHVFAIYARYWLHWTNKRIAQHPMMQCSQSLALKIRRVAERKIRIIVPYQQARERLHKDKQ